MSSLRPARIVATLLRLIDGSLAGVDDPTGPPCSCLSCDEAWRRNQGPKVRPHRAMPATATRGLGLGY